MDVAMIQVIGRLQKNWLIEDSILGLVRFWRLKYNPLYVDEQDIEYEKELLEEQAKYPF